MIGLIGLPPKSLLNRGESSMGFFDTDGGKPHKSSSNVTDDRLLTLLLSGNFRYPDLVPRNFTFENSLQEIQGEDKNLFVDFAKKMITWLPKDRATAQELLLHPWLEHWSPDALV